MGHLSTPVALFIFNRPHKTAEVVDQITAVEPSTLLIVADGPRENHPEDPSRCEHARSVVEEAVEWDCDLRWNVADENLGLKRRFVTGLEWIFEQEQEAIILEDDCVPSESFFRFCSEMLDEYRHDERIMDIAGSNHLGEWKSDRQDYHFSLYGGIWGWATWRRAWEWYDPEMELWEDSEVRQRVRDVIAVDDQADYIEYIFDKVYEGEIETWDYQWGFARYINSALSIVPSRNLVSNIGFDDDATNTDAEDSDLSAIPRNDLDFPIDRQKYVAVDREYDRRFHLKRPLSERYRFFRNIRDICNLFST